DAAVHERQALVLVNRGGASGEAIARLANEVKKAVFMKFGVWLEPEVNIL
ncbi:MAG: UDP-N-acetylenolpyruvoylglucosamine reductase, partial [Odoribacteraceae bacterium]|nr:UDP-N-acetylenolpyruvoylglucosamine reductase [Odoribacteraceae bacterium]